MYLEKINGPSDLKKLNFDELNVLSEELRQYVFDVVKANGGHLSSNLGTIELTVALLYVFGEEDKILFDVGHQSYAYKILTGRREAFCGLRKKGGLSGFSDPAESDADSFCSGHSSTSISAGLGMAAARDLKGESYNVVSVIGDGAMGGGVAFEGLNNVGQSDTKFLVILNDNEMSIAKNVGALSKHFARIRTRKSYVRFKHGFSRFLRAIPLVGKPLSRGIEWVRDRVRDLFAKNILFEHFHLKYLGTIDGHNLKKLIPALEVAREENRPVMVHVHTKKGKGIPACEEYPDIYHGVSKDLVKKQSTLSEVAGAKLAELAEKDSRIVAVTAAMPEGTGLTAFAEKFPSRFFDVGIAEQHAVSFSCGLAKSGMIPYFAVYSTFLQRAFDEVLCDACANDIPLKLLVDRAGLVGNDGKTHQGVFDISYLTCIPGMTLLSPKDAQELEDMIAFSAEYPHPVAIRYPNSVYANFPPREFERGAYSPFEWEVLREEDSPCVVVAEGNRLLSVAFEASKLARAEVISARCIKPLDTETLDRIGGRRIVVLEDNVLAGGLGSMMAEYYANKGVRAELVCLGVPDRFIGHASVEEQYAEIGFTPERVAALIRGENPGREEKQ